MGIDTSAFRQYGELAQWQSNWLLTHGQVFNSPIPLQYGLFVYRLRMPACHAGEMGSTPIQAAIYADVVEWADTWGLSPHTQWV